MQRANKEDLPDSHLRVVKEALEGGSDDRLRSILSHLHAAQIADVLEALPTHQRLNVWKVLDSPTRGDVLIEMHREGRRRLVGEASSADLVSAVQRLELDELADLDAELPAEVVEAVVRAMDGQRRRRYEAVREYPDDTAGGLMDPGALAVRADVTLEMVLRYLRGLRRGEGQIPEHTDSVVVVDRENRYEGILSLADLVSLPPHLKVREAMVPDVMAIDADMPASRVARLFEDHDWMSAPVVDEHGRLIGRITIDDVVDVIREEADRSVMSRAGLSEESDMFSPVLSTVRQRAIWLGVNLVNAFVAAYVIGLFEETIERVVALAILMPVVASMGGVAGNQTLTLVIRGLALEQVGYANAGRLLLKELGVGLVNGFFWALLVSGVVAFWFHDPRLGGIFATALIVNLAAAALAGTLVPLILDRLGIDPALAGGVVLTATTDIVGFASFLGLANWLL